MSDGVYVDSSAYISVLLNEYRGAEIRALLKNRRLYSSTLLLLETERTLVNNSRNGNLAFDLYQAALEQVKLHMHSFTLKDVTAELALSGSYPAVKTPRTADLIHLRTALWFATNGFPVSFLSLDHHQVSSARELGIPVALP